MGEEEEREEKKKGFSRAPESTESYKLILSISCLHWRYMLKADIHINIHTNIHIHTHRHTCTHFPSYM